jgi:hypothetical protein
MQLVSKYRFSLAMPSSSWSQTLSPSGIHTSSLMPLGVSLIIELHCLSWPSRICHLHHPFFYLTLITWPIQDFCATPLHYSKAAISFCGHLHTKCFISTHKLQPWSSYVHVDLLKPPAMLYPTLSNNSLRFVPNLLLVQLYCYFFDWFCNSPSFTCLSHVPNFP